MSEKKRPGTKVMSAGLWIASIGVAIIILAMASGGDIRAIWIVIVGLLVAAIGYAQRLLHAVENKSASND